jgi:hypothetical protein
MVTDGFYDVHLAGCWPCSKRVLYYMVAQRNTAHVQAVISSDTHRSEIKEAEFLKQQVDDDLADMTTDLMEEKLNTTNLRKTHAEAVRRLTSTHTKAVSTMKQDNDEAMKVFEDKNKKALFSINMAKGKVKASQAFVADQRAHFVIKEHKLNTALDANIAEMVATQTPPPFAQWKILFPAIYKGQSPL